MCFRNEENVVGKDGNQESNEIEYWNDVKIMTEEKERERAKILISSFRQTQLFLRGWNFFSGSTSGHISVGIRVRYLILISRDTTQSILES